MRSTTAIYVLATTAENDDSGTGLMTGDVIVALNETPILSVQQLRQVLEKLPDSKPVVVQIERRGQFHFLTIEPD